MKFADIPLMPRAHYSITMDWADIERHLAHAAKHPGEEIILDPEYQRGHVWTPEQQTAYVEYVLMGGEAAKDLLFNCPGFTGGGKYGPYEIVDGLQRLTAARAFMRGDIRAFGHFRHEYTDRPRMHVAFNWRVMELPTRAEVLKAYLAFNSGGVVHSSDEIARVKALLAKETTWR